ncbi:MAG: uroporphyrinogen-III C-methyltransferase [Bryobacteraceae bacterium]|nr:uroporphyrinogen-III C-methyltransferase [Bryobacteraceae bacterium]
MTGKVYLVGAGPGDPELLTRKGLRVLGRADAVLYDHLASPSLLDLAPAHAERVYVGKKRSAHAFSQDEIVALLIERARRGLTVVRLKGGDPFIFGRGGEEIEGLAQAGIEYEVVPGVTTPLGIAAYTGVPLTHREHSSVVTFITGHDVDAIDWGRSCLSGTVVIFMGLQHLGEIVGRLLKAGRSPHTPAMAVRWATRPDQQTITGSLAELPSLVHEAGLLPPVTVVVGEVVSLRQRLSWFEKRPLSGQRIIVTRAQAQASEFSAKLLELGAAVIELPVIEMAPLADYSELDARIAELESYDWIVLTSVNAVDYFLARLAECGRDARAIRGRICAIGPATRDALAAAHLRADLVPEESVSEGVAAAFGGFDLQNARVLLPRAASAREVIPEALTRLGARVDIADAYRNVVPLEAEGRIAVWQHSGRGADWIAFTSGSTVKNWLALAGAESLRGVRIASVGPATSEVVRKHGLEVAVEADPHTTDGLIAAIRNYQR